MSNPHQIRKLLEEYLLTIPTQYWLNFSSGDLEDYMLKVTEQIQLLYKQF